VIRLLRGALAPALLLAALTSLPAAAQDAGVSLPVGSNAPDASLQDLDGNAVQLSDFMTDGRMTLIEFWATWCENCEELQPQMDAVHERYGDRVNVVAVAVAVAQSQRRVRRHLERHEPGYPHLWDADGAAVRAYEAATTSIVVLVGSDGKVAYTGVGGDQDLVAAVERALGDS
jgi:cytochrome c biogenesis protein CcmG/thiol:disulfide interchange protein DsbE